MNRDPSGASLANTWIIYVAYLVVFTMVACLVWLVSGLAGGLFKAWDARGVLLLSLLAAIEALASYQFARRSPAIRKGIAYYYVTEWLFNLVVIKIFTELRAGPAHLWGNILSWPVDFPSNLLNGDFLLNTFLVYVAWQVTSLFISDLFRLDVKDTAPRDELIASASAQEKMRRRFFVLGMVLTILAGIKLHEFPAASPSQTIIIVVLFFMLGFYLLSLAKFANLQILWRQARVKVPSDIPRHWFLYSFFILILLAALSIWLPTTYSLGFFDTVLYLINALTTALNILFAFILALFGFIGKLFASKGQEPVQELESATPLPASPPPQVSPPLPLWEMIGSIIFWGVLVALVIVVLRQYLAFNRDLFKELKRFRLINWLAESWGRLKNLFQNAKRQVATLVELGLGRLRGAGEKQAGRERWDYINVRRLSARQKILFYYYALLRRLGDSGLPRRAGQTPYEYARSLAASLQEEKEGLDAITESFVEARYTRHAIPVDIASQVQSLWERLRRLLRKK